MKWFKDLRISLKLIFGFITIALIACVISIVGVVSIRSLQEVDNLLFTQNLGGMGYTGDNFGHFNGLRFTLTKYSIEGEEEDRVSIEEAISTIDALVTEYA